MATPLKSNIVLQWGSMPCCDYSIDDNSTLQRPRHWRAMLFFSSQA